MEETKLSSEPISEWIPIVDYSVLSGISMSTLRRYIKTNRIKWKIEGGKYLIPAEAVVEKKPASGSFALRRIVRPNWDGVNPEADVAANIVQAKRHMSQVDLPSSAPQAASNTALVGQVIQLEQRLLRAEEQIAELRMLLALYEDQLTRATAKVAR